MLVNKSDNRKESTMALYRIWLARGVGTRRNRESLKAMHVRAPSVNEAEQVAKKRFPHRIVYNLERLDTQQIETHGILV